MFLQHPFVQHSSTPHGREGFDSENTITFDAVDSFIFGVQLTMSNTLYLSHHDPIDISNSKVGEPKLSTTANTNPLEFKILGSIYL